MKKLALFLLAASCLLLCACSNLPSAISPSCGILSPSVTPMPTLSPQTSATVQSTPEAEATPEDGPFSWVSEEFIADQIAAADACRVETQDFVYYFDTSVYLIFWYNLEFPLYKKEIDTGLEYYLGTTGYYFQLFRSYIYIKSDIYQEDYPIGEVTRLVDLETGTITPFGYNVDIFIPAEGEYVYFTYDMVSSIYKADASLKQVKKLVIKIPEQDEIEKEYGNMEDFITDITITDVADGWICFLYDVFMYEGPGIYEGSYRIHTDGTGLEKTDEGIFYEE